MAHIGAISRARRKRNRFIVALSARIGPHLLSLAGSASYMRLYGIIY